MNTGDGTFLPMRVAAFVLAALLAGCVPRTSNELQGRYSATYGVHDVDLILRSGGTYQQVVTSRNRPPQVVSVGSWAYHPDKVAIDFTNLRLPTSADCGGGQSCLLDDAADTSLPVERQFFVWTIQLKGKFGPYVKQD